MPFCQAPLNTNIFNVTKCGKKIISNSELHLCQYHYDILLNSPPPYKLFPKTNKCLFCNNNLICELGICHDCLENHSDININFLLKKFEINPELIKTCNYTVIEIFKDYLSEFDYSLPRKFDFNIDKTNKCINILHRNIKKNKKIYYDENYNFDVIWPTTSEIFKL